MQRPLTLTLSQREREFSARWDHVTMLKNVPPFIEVAYSRQDIDDS